MGGEGKCCEEAETGRQSRSMMGKEREGKEVGQKNHSLGLNRRAGQDEMVEGRAA